MNHSSAGKPVDQLHKEARYPRADGFALDVSADRPLMPLRVLLVDHCMTFRESLAQALEQDPGIQVVGKADSGDEMLSAGSAPEADVAVIEVDLPDQSGFDLGCKIRSYQPGLSTLLLSYYDWDVYLVCAWATKAAGLVLRSALPQDLKTAIQKASIGRNIFTAEQILRVQAWEAEHGARLRDLSLREWEVLWLVSGGKSNRDIARLLKVGENTIEKHVTNILCKTNLSSRAVLLSYVFKQHIDVLNRLAESTRLILFRENENR